MIGNLSDRSLGSMKILTGYRRSQVELFEKPFEVFYRVINSRKGMGPKTSRSIELNHLLPLQIRDGLGLGVLKLRLDEVPQAGSTFLLMDLERSIVLWGHKILGIVEQGSKLLDDLHTNVQEGGPNYLLYQIGT